MPKLTDAEKAVRDELLKKYTNAIHGPDRVGEFANFTKFRIWAMAHGFQPGSELRRRDTEEDFTPENCYFADYEDRAPFTKADMAEFTRRWNRAVNPAAKSRWTGPVPGP